MSPREGLRATSGELFQEGAAAAGDDDVSHLRSAARGGAFTFAGLILNAIFSFGFIALVSHTLPQGSAGGFFEAMSLWTIASTVAVLGADVGLVRTIPWARSQSPRHLRWLVYIASSPVIAVSLVLAIGVFVAAPEIANLIVNARLQSATTSQLRFLAPLIPFGGLSTVLLTGARVWTTTQSVSVQYILVPVLRCVMLGLFAAASITAFNVAFSWGLPVFVGAVGSIVVMGRLVHRDHAAPPSAVGSDAVSEFGRGTLGRRDLGIIAKHFWNFAAPRSVEGTLLVLIAWLNVVLVGALASPRQAAPYAGATRYVILGGFALQAIGIVVAPQVSRLSHREDRKATLQLYQASTVWVVIAAFPPLLTLAAFAPTFMGLLGRGYRIGAPALALLSLSMLANASTGSNAMFLLMSGRSRQNLVVTAVSLATNLTLNLLLIPTHGLNGAAVAWAASTVLTAVVMGALVWRSLRLQPFCPAYGLALTAALVCFGLPGLILRFTLGSSLVVFVVFGVFACLAYAGLLFRYRGLLQLDVFLRSRLRASNAGEIAGTI